MAKFKKIADEDGDTMLLDMDNIVGFCYRRRSQEDYTTVPVLFCLFSGHMSHVGMPQGFDPIVFANEVRERGHQVAFTTDNVSGGVAWLRPDSVLYCTYSADEQATHVVLGTRPGIHSHSPAGITIKEPLEDVERTLQGFDL
ncbi:MAG TPA: hypothetical protein VKA48_10940 [Gammaproteobacteria bacterium]|nr:hypothetical protein [Gammaproteobacteria bacterium]